MIHSSTLMLSIYYCCWRFKIGTNRFKIPISGLPFHICGKICSSVKTSDNVCMTLVFWVNILTWFEDWLNPHCFFPFSSKKKVNSLMCSFFWLLDNISVLEMQVHWIFFFYLGIILPKGEKVWIKKMNRLKKVKSLLDESRERGLKPWRKLEEYAPQNHPSNWTKNVFFKCTPNELHQMRTRLLWQPLLAFNLKEGQCLRMWLMSVLTVHTWIA